MILAVMSDVCNAYIKHMQVSPVLRCEHLKGYFCPDEGFLKMIWPKDFAGNLFSPPDFRWTRNVTLMSSGKFSFWAQSARQLYYDVMGSDALTPRH